MNHTLFICSKFNFTCFSIFNCFSYIRGNSSCFFGFGIKPFGPRTLPNLPKGAIISGVAIKVSNSNQPPAILSIISSAPASSAPASFAAAALSAFAITQTLTVLPRPAGRTVVDLICWSACLTSIP